MRTENTTKEPIYKMANIMRNVIFLSLAVNLFEIYGFIREPRQARDLISIGLGIAGTVLIWLFTRSLGQAQKQALYFWLAACLLSYTRWIFIDVSFQPGVFSLFLIALTVVFTVRIATWVKNGFLA
jgi:predicted neutral ceramidase superfamily lipid hydrolase